MVSAEMFVKPFSAWVAKVGMYWIPVGMDVPALIPSVKLHSGETGDFNRFLDSRTAKFPIFFVIRQQYLFMSLIEAVDRGIVAPKRFHPELSRFADFDVIPRQMIEIVEEIDKVSAMFQTKLSYSHPRYSAHDNECSLSGCRSSLGSHF